MMEMPSGNRNSAPVPLSTASGSAPNSAASVVIMIGRKRSRQACTIASSPTCPGALRLQREVDHHDRVLLDDAHQEDDADQADHGQILPEQHQRQDGADTGRRQRRENGDRVDVALIEHAEHDVDGDERGQDQPRLSGQRFGEFGRIAPEHPTMLPGMPILRFDGLHRLDRIAQRLARARQVEAERHGRETAPDAKSPAVPWCASGSPPPTSGTCAPASAPGR